MSNALNLSEIDGQINKLFRSGRLNTQEHLDLEKLRAEQWQLKHAAKINAPPGLDADSLGYWHQRAQMLLGPFAIINIVTS